MSGSGFSQRTGLLDRLSRKRRRSDPSPSPSHTRRGTPALIDPNSTPTPNDLPVAATHSHRISPGHIAQTALTGLEGLLASLHIFPLLQGAISEFIGCLDCPTEQNRQEYEEILSELTKLANQLQKYTHELKPTHTPCSISNIARAIEEQSQYIREKQNRSKRQQLISAKEDGEDIPKCYRRVEALFRQLLEDLSSDTRDIARASRMDSQLNNLLPAHDAYYNAALSEDATERGGCTANTRVELLGEFKVWSRKEGSVGIFWMNGMAGTGKTAIAYSLCEQLERDSQLGASFFCSRNSPNCRDVNRIIPTIAYRLARYSIPYKSVLCHVLETEPDVARLKIPVQFQKLLVEPLERTKKAMPSDVVVVIDALDECTNSKGTQHLVALLLQNAVNLPIKIFVSSRPDPIITRQMGESTGPHSILLLHDIEQSIVQTDIVTYLREALASMEPTEAVVEQLAARAGRLFIYAATAVRYILPDDDSVDSHERLHTVLEINPVQGSKRHEELDALYATILLKALDQKRLEGRDVDRRKLILWTIICAKEPLTPSTLAELLDTHSEQQIRLAVAPFQSVIHISARTSVVSTLHQSFPDFLLNAERAGPFYCNAMQHSSYLATHCFSIMKRTLRFNICGLDSSYLPDRDVPGLQSRVETAISPGLSYACQYWGDHLRESTVSEPLLSALLAEFMEYRLLFWMEVLNLKGWIGYGEGVLSQALRWLLNDNNSAHLHEFVYDARNFVTAFAANCAALSTPHIYISLLPLTHKRSLVWTTYWPRTRGLIEISSSVINTQNSPLVATWNVGSHVYSIAQSSDGKLIASGSRDGSVNVWDATQGTRILGPLNSILSLGRISAVAYSPIGTRIASASDSGYVPIRIWDVNNGSSISALDGQLFKVRSIAFSPDGSRLACGCEDQTIRICDAYSGRQIGDALQGYQGSIRSVTFSPVEEQLASASADSRNGTIRIWDWRNNVSIGELQAEDGAVSRAVCSIAYRFDGLRLVSGYYNGSLRVWEVHSRVLAAEQPNHLRPEIGHVASVAFSPDGSKIVSTVYAGIRVWDAENMNLLVESKTKDLIYAALFTPDSTRIISGSSSGEVSLWDSRPASGTATERGKHPKFQVSSVAFSPDGNRISSGSVVGLLYVWDAHNGALIAGPFKGHTKKVASIAFSSDGTRIVSVSVDLTLHVWDAYTGKSLVGPLKAHPRCNGHWTSRAAFLASDRLIGCYVDASYDKVQLWNSATGEPVAWSFGPEIGTIKSLAQSPDGATIVTGSSNNVIQMWDTDNPALPLWSSLAYDGELCHLQFLPDGTRIGCCFDDNTAAILKAENGDILYSIATDLDGRNTAESLAFSPDGTRLLLASTQCTIYVWDMENGTLIAGPLKGHTKYATSLAFSPNGERFVSGSEDGSIRFWELTSADGSGLGDFEHPSDNHGWLTDPRKRRLLWLPPPLRDIFPLPCQSLMIVDNEPVTVNYRDLLLGERWHECYLDLA